MRQDLETLDHLNRHIAELEAEVARLSTQPPWEAQMTFLMQLPGFSLLLSMTVLAAIGDITRFPSPRHLVGYAGRSRLERRTLSPLPEGRIRAFVAKRMPSNKAIVAVARRLLVAVWHVLTRHEADRHAQPICIASKFMRWAWELTPEQRHGLASHRFIRYHLMRIHLAHDPTRFTYGGQPRRIATAQEGLALTSKQNPESGA